MSYGRALSRPSTSERGGESYVEGAFEWRDRLPRGTTPTVERPRRARRRRPHARHGPGAAISPRARSRRAAGGGAAAIRVRYERLLGWATSPICARRRHWGHRGAVWGRDTLHACTAPPRTRAVSPSSRLFVTCLNRRRSRPDSARAPDAIKRWAPALPDSARERAQRTRSSLPRGRRVKIPFSSSWLHLAQQPRARQRTGAPLPAIQWEGGKRWQARALRSDPGTLHRQTRGLGLAGVPEASALARGGSRSVRRPNEAVEFYETSSRKAALQARSRGEARARNRPGVGITGTSRSR